MPRSPTGFNDLDPKDQLAAYGALRSFESDFDRAQGTLRVVASTWILAIVGALGFLILQGPVSEGQGAARVSAEMALMLRQGVLAIGTFGILGLWHVDQRVYQRLLHAAFAFGCNMECRNPFLPPVRIYMFERVRDVSAGLSRFYALPVALMLLGGLLNLLLDWPGASAAGAMFEACVKAPVACVTRGWWMAAAAIFAVQALAFLANIPMRHARQPLETLLPTSSQRRTALMRAGMQQ